MDHGKHPMEETLEASVPLLHLHPFLRRQG